MGRLSGGAHEISGVVVLWGVAGWVVRWVGGVVDGCCVCGAGGGVSSVCGWCVHGGVGGVFVVVGCAGEEWGGWVVVCWVDLYNP